MFVATSNVGSSWHSRCYREREWLSGTEGWGELGLRVFVMAQNGSGLSWLGVGLLKEVRRETFCHESLDC